MNALPCFYVFRKRLNLFRVQTVLIGEIDFRCIRKDLLRKVK